MLLLRQEGPVKVTGAVLHQVRHVRAGQDVEREPLAGLLDERDVEVADDLAAGAIATEEKAGLDLVGALGDAIVDLADDDVGAGTLAVDELGVEDELPAVVGGVAGEDRLELRLREIHMVARTRCVVFSLVHL